MGFIEELKKEAEVKKQAQLIAEQEAKRERVAILERANEQRRQVVREEGIRKEIWRKAEGHFEQTGLRQMAQELIDIKAAVCLRDINEASRVYHREDDPFIKALGDYTTYLFIGSEFVGNNWIEQRYMGIAVSRDGVVTFEGTEKKRQIGRGFLGLKKAEEIDVPLRISIDKKEWMGNRSVLEGALGKAYEHPNKYRFEDFSSSGSGGPPNNETGFCLPGDSLISVPKGSVSIKNLKIGDLVWTVNRFEQKIQTSIIQKSRRPVSKCHRMAHIVLEDGRELIASPGHPTIDNKELGSLKKGQILDNSKIVSLQIMPYKEKYTYDILPSGDTGAYWANNILIRSTLSNQFKQTQWHRQLFA